MVLWMLSWAQDVIQTVLQWLLKMDFDFFFPFYLRQCFSDFSSYKLPHFSLFSTQARKTKADPITTILWEMYTIKLCSNTWFSVLFCS